jgi:hypothetical protein
MIPVTASIGYFFVAESSMLRRIGSTRIRLYRLPIKRILPNLADNSASLLIVISVHKASTLAIQLVPVFQCVLRSRNKQLPTLCTNGFYHAITPLLLK